jgi:hypothetical protein
LRTSVAQWGQFRPWPSSEADANEQTFQPS